MVRLERCLLLYGTVEQFGFKTLEIMKIDKTYVVYRLNHLPDTDTRSMLEKMDFSGWRVNNFKTEKEALEAIIADDLTYEDFIILKHYYLKS